MIRWPIIWGAVDCGFQGNLGDPPSAVAVVLRSERRSDWEDGMGFEETMDAIARGVEVLGIATLVLGLAAALVRAGSPYLPAKVRRRSTGSSAASSGGAFCWGWSCWSRPTSSGPWPFNLRSKTSLSSG